MNNYIREYTFIIPPSTLVKNPSYTSSRQEAQDLVTAILALHARFVQQGKISPTDLGIDWNEVPGTSEYRVSLFTTVNAVTPEITEAIHALAVKHEFTTLIRTAEIQDVFYAGKLELALYFMNTYTSTGNNKLTFAEAEVGAKNAYAKQNCKPLTTNVPTEREVDLSLPETKTTVLRDLGIRNTLYKLKSVVVTLADNTVTCKLEGPRGEITHKVPVDREVWVKWPLGLKEAINAEIL